ncbi:MAG: peptidoglycan recognition family protein, partial [Hyphomicrobiaceae bacterium]
IRAARSDPLGAGIIFCCVLLAGLGVAHLTGTTEAVVRVVTIPWRAAMPGPLAWLRRAKPGDVLTVPGYPVAYWGKPDAAYGKSATEHAVPPVAVVIHHTAGKSLLKMVRYGHNEDSDRGGSYGYHIYIDSEGRIAQGAPLTRRTNHVKPVGAKERKAAGAHVWNANSIGVSMVGACLVKPGKAATEQCIWEDLTPQQVQAGLAVVEAIRSRFGIACEDVYGHGELQHDREAFEGQMVAVLTRAKC